MVSRIAILQTDAAWRERLREQPVGHEFELKYFEDTEKLYENLQTEPRQLELVVLGSNVPDPIRTAQHIHAIRGNLEILILCDDKSYPHTKQALRFSPFLGSQVRCSLDQPGELLSAEFVVAAARTRGRRRHRAWIDAAQRSLSDSSAPDRSVHVLDRLLSQAPIGVVLVTVDGKVVACNKMVERLLSIEERQILGRSFEELFPDDAQRCLAGWLKSAATDVDPHKWETIETRNSSAGDRCFRMNGSIVLARSNQRLVLILMEDITAARVQEQALRESQSELRNVAGRLLTAQEDERSRLAREIHDDATQRVAMLALEAGMLERKADEASKIREGLAGLRSRLAQLSVDLQSLSHQLHPSILVHLGLEEAIAAECDRLSKLDRMVIDFSSHRFPEEIPIDVSLCFYRTLQECLGNAIKHSGAKRVRVVLTGRPDFLELSIRDSGVGFDVAQQVRDPGLGLVSMKERARLVQGELTVRSQPGKGTTIQIRVPLATQEHQQGN